MHENRAFVTMAAIAAAAALLAGCGGSDDSGEAAVDTTPDQATSTTEVAASGHDSPEAAAAFCETMKSRDGNDVVALMSADAVAVDHATGRAYVGSDQIAAWIDDNEGFDTFELTSCAETGTATNWWSAGTYAFHSDTNAGGTEGVAVIRSIDGEIDEFHALYTLTTDEPSSAAVVSAADASAVTAWCEAWGTEDPEQVLPLAAEGLIVRSRTGEERPGDEDQIRKMTFMLAEDPEDTVECGSDVIGNGGWVALTSRFVDTDNPDGDWGGSWGGIMMVRTSEDDLVSEHAHFMDAMDADGNYVDVTQLDTGEIIINDE